MRLDAENITAGYGDSEILHDVSIDVKSGEFVGLVGPNGCGKSTLLRTISRTLQPKSGSARLDGADVWEMSAIELARKVSFVPQQEPANFDFTVRDVVLMGRYPHRVKNRGEDASDYELVRLAMQEADIADLEDRPITRLSGGEHRRVLVARALAQNTPLMLLDEPTAHLDVTHQAELLSLIQRRVQKQGMGALAALHELNHAAEFCDRLVLMRAGTVVCQGSPDQVLTPENLRIAYGARSRVGRNPITGRPMILTLSSLRGDDASQVSWPVHVICGGGSGIHILHSLLRSGYLVTAGVLNESDNDFETASALGIETAAEMPFSPISAGASDRAAEYMRRAEAILIANVPFGPGNLLNLQLAELAQRQGKMVVLLDGDDIGARDFTGGEASRIYRSLESGGAKRYATVEEWIGEAGDVYAARSRITA